MNTIEMEYADKQQRLESEKDWGNLVLTVIALLMGLVISLASIGIYIL